MMTMMMNPKRILAVDPSSRGFGYVVLEDPERLVDWGLKEARANKDTHCLNQIKYLIALYKPDMIAVEDVMKGSQRSPRVRSLIGRIQELAKELHIPARAVTKHDRRRAFDALPSPTKEDIAREIADRFPELDLHLPRPRKPWEGQNPNMAIFQAAALAVSVETDASPDS